MRKIEVNVLVSLHRERTVDALIIPLRYLSSPETLTGRLMFRNGEEELQVYEYTVPTAFSS